MYLQVDSVPYELSEAVIDELLVLLLNFGYDAYKSQDITKQLAAKMFARKMLEQMEKKAPNLRSTIRPPKGDDPVIHLAQLAASIGKQVLLESNATIKLQTSTTEQGRSASITSFSYEPTGTSEGGGQLADPGQEGQWKDDIRQDAPVTTQPPLSFITSLYPGYKTT